MISNAEFWNFAYGKQTEASVNVAIVKPKLVMVTALYAVLDLVFELQRTAWTMSLVEKLPKNIRAVQSLTALLYALNP